MSNESDSNPSNGSFFKHYSQGIVAANKPLGSDEIEVTPMEDTPALSGEVTDNSQTYDAKGASTNGSTFSASIETTASIKAKWYSGSDTNRITAPDVRRGEEVEILRYADTDQYFWRTSQQNKSLRRLETVIHSWSNNSKENVDNDFDSTYSMEISTHRKVMRLHTAKNDDEFCAFDIQIDTKNGTVVIQDDVDDYIFLDAKNRQIKFKNADDSFIDINKKTIEINAPDSVTINTKAFALNASASNTIKSPTNSTEGNTQLIKATTTNDGTLTVTKMATLNGGFVASNASGSGGDVGHVIGPVRFSSAATFESSVQINGNLHVDGIISTPNPISAPNV